MELPSELSARDRRVLARIVTLFATHETYDLSMLREQFLYNRIRLRVGQLPRVHSLTSYERFVSTHPEERRALLREFTIPESYFFRDGEVWEAFREQLLVPLLEAWHDPAVPLRVWSAGCCWGQEPYTLAMMWNRLPPEVHPSSLELVATDYSAEPIAKARAGVFHANHLKFLPPAYKGYFTRVTERKWRLAPEIVRAVDFRRHDLLTDAPLSGCDIIICRNVLIYFRPAAHLRVLEHFWEALKPDGYLVLGATESLPSAFYRRFRILDPRAKFYQRLEREASPRPTYFEIPPPTSLEPSPVSPGARPTDSPAPRPSPDSSTPAPPPPSEPEIEPEPDPTSGSLTSPTTLPEGQSHPARRISSTPREVHEVSSGAPPAESFKRYLSRQVGVDVSRIPPDTFDAHLESRMRALLFHDRARYEHYAREYPEREIPFLVQVLGQPDPRTPLTSPFWRHVQMIFRGLSHGGNSAPLDFPEGRPLHVASLTRDAGLEAFTLAILYRRVFWDLDAAPLRISAIVPDEKEVQALRQGQVSRERVPALPPKLARYFTETAYAWVARPEIVAQVEFHHVPLEGVADLRPVDVVCYRDHLFFQKVPAREMMLERIHSALVRRGVLFLGPLDELPPAAWPLFALQATRPRVYRKL